MNAPTSTAGWAVRAALLLACGVAHAAAEPLPPTLELLPGELHSVSVEQLARVAIGDPHVADITVVSERELLIQAKQAGTTYLIVWDHRGRSTVKIDVMNRAPEELLAQLRRVLDQLGLGDVQLKREGEKILVIGQVPSEEDRDRIEQVVALFAGAANLTTVPTVPPPPVLTPPMVQLSVQVVEINRTDLERLGVKWSESLATSEPSGTDLTPSDLFFRWGTSLTRTSVSATLNALVSKNRARLLAEPKLTTSSGKTAEAFLGGEVPILSSQTAGLGTGTVSTNIEFKEFGVKLKVTPTVSPETGKIVTKLDSEVSAIDTGSAINVGGISVPGFKTRKTQTEIVAESGETIVVAGLLQSEDSKVVSQVPGLGEIPVFGRLFRSPEFQNRETELVITVTPLLMVDAAATADKVLALEEALASAEVAGAVEDPKLRYLLQIQDRIAKAMRYPQRERELGIEGRVKLRLHLFADGTLGRALVAESSGIEALDLEALKAAETQSPYPPFPSQLSQQEVWLDVPVIFRP